MAETSKPSRRRRSAAPVNRRTTSVTWGKHASGFDGSFKRTKYGYPSASARLAMQAESSLWGRKRVVGSKLKHDGTLGYISRGAARRSGLNPAGWHRYVPIVAVVAVIVIALAALGYAGGGANLDAVFKSPELAHAGTEVIEGAQTQTGVAPQRGIVAAASTIADAQKDEDEQGERSRNGPDERNDDNSNINIACRQKGTFLFCRQFGTLLRYLTYTTLSRRGFASGSVSSA